MLRDLHITTATDLGLWSLDDFLRVTNTPIAFYTITLSHLNPCQIGFNRVQARKLEQIGRVACGQDTTATVTLLFPPLLLSMEKPLTPP